jgi:hypothetical protein
LGSAAQFERAFNVRLEIYRSPLDGRLFHAPADEPTIPASLAGIVSGIVGLDDAAVPTPGSLHRAPDVIDAAWHSGFAIAPRQTDAGPEDGLTPSDVRTAYNMTGIGQTGVGQTIALFEEDGYLLSDVQAYESYFGLPSTSITNIYVDGAGGGVATVSGQAEVTLDIELALAIAPEAKILVYEAPNNGTSAADLYNRIATDDAASVVSTSWLSPEALQPASELNVLDAAFQQMAAQGQSIFACAGDHGAYEEYGSAGVTGDGPLGVASPASDPYVVGVGGTALTTGADGLYETESTWNEGSPEAGAGGGGVSGFWTIPGYQSGVIAPDSLGSNTYRNVPDVSLCAGQPVGYSVFVGSQWVFQGGTSCGAPLWAAFTSLVNEERASAGIGPLGFPNPAIYAIAKTSSYASVFHDIADGSTNLYYPAVMGFDDATGWGTPNGEPLYEELISLTVGLSAAQINQFTPTSGPAGTAVSIYGVGFTGATGVKFGGVATTQFDVLNDGDIVATVPTGAVSGPITVTLPAGAPLVSTTNFTVIPPLAIQSLTLSPNPVAPNVTQTGTVTLTGPAPADGAMVDIYAGSRLVTSVSIAAGQTSGFFYLTWPGVQTTTITATYNGSTVEATAIVTTGAATGLSSLSLSPNPAAPGASLTGTVTLASSGAAASIPIVLDGSTVATALIASGASGGSFQCTAPATGGNYVYSATYNGTTVSTTLAVSYDSSVVPLALTGLRLAPPTIAPGGSTAGTFTLNGQAPSGGAAIRVLVNDFPFSTVMVPAGQMSATSTFTTSDYTPSGEYVFKGLYNGSSATATLTVSQSPVLASLVFTPSTIKRGGTAKGTVTLSAAAPANGEAVWILYQDFPLTVVSIAAGRTTGSFVLPTESGMLAGTYTFDAELGDSSVFAALDVTD